MGPTRLSYLLWVLLLVRKVRIVGQALSRYKVV